MAAITIAVWAIFGVVPPAYAWCTDGMNIGCPACGSEGTVYQANKVGGLGGTCGPRNTRCNFPRPAPSNNTDVFELAAAAADYAQRHNGASASANVPEAYGVDMDADLIREIAVKDPFAAYSLYGFHASRWLPHRSLYKGGSITSMLVDQDLVESLLAGVTYDEITASASRLPEGVGIEISWKGKDSDDDTLAVRFQTKTLNDENHAVPKFLYDTITTVYINRSTSTVIAYSQTEAN